MTALEARSKLIATRQQFGQGLATIDQLNKAADDYIATLKAYKKKTGKKMRIPSRAYVIRAILASMTIFKKQLPL